MNEFALMEQEVTQLLQEHAQSLHAKEVLAPRIAKASLMMHHLYEDLGFGSRTQMGRFMMENFRSLAEQKPKEKLWKKYIYECIGKIAPACATCSDQLTCFSCRVSEVA